MRVAVQQSALTGSAEPLVATLKQSDERLARYNQPRLEGDPARDRPRPRPGQGIERRRRRDPRRSSSTRRCAWSTSCRCSRRRSRAATSLRKTGRRSRRRGRRAAAASASEDLGDRVSRELGRREPLLRRQHLVGDPLAGADHADRPSGGDAARAGPGLLPAREPEAAPAQRAPGADGAPVRHRPGRPASGRRARSSATSIAARSGRRSPPSCCARSRSRRAAPACRGPTTRWRRWPPPAPR